MSKGGGSVQMPSPEEYMPLIRQSTELNRLNQSTPFGQTQYVKGGDDPLSFEDWSAQTPTRPDYDQWVNDTYGPDGNQFAPAAYDNMFKHVPAPSQEDYNKYVQEFNATRPVTVEQSFSPEIQGLFSQQFDENAYQQYADDYMSEARRLLDPVWDRNQERFQQTMANRGQPVGGELYDDEYKNLMEAMDSSYKGAAFQGTQLSDQKRLQDFNRLMAAFGGSQVAYPQVDSMGAANMAMNANVANAQNQANQSSSIWNAIPGLAAAYFTAGSGTPGVWGAP